MIGIEKHRWGSIPLFLLGCIVLAGVLSICFQLHTRPGVAACELAQENTGPKRAEKQQRYYTQLLKSVTDNASSMLYMVDAAGLGTFVNPAFERITGYRAEEVIGQIVHDKIHHTKSDGTPYPMHECPLIGVARTGKIVQGEDRFLRKDNMFFPVRYTASPIFREGAAVGAVIEAQDLTENNRVEEAWREAQAQLAHVTRVASLGELAGSIAHEVNQPLTAVINNADACLALLPAEISKLDQLREALSDIISDADRASAVLERIRGLIKKSPPQKSRLDLNETIRGVIVLARGPLDRNEILLRTKLANDLPPIMGDRIHLQQVKGRGDEQRIEAEEALLRQGFVAQAVSDRGKITVHFSSALVPAHDTSASQLPESLLRYVVRTRESVTLADASVQNLFSQDEYIERNRPRSVFCLPLIRQGKLTGILYLENKLTPSVFTPNRLATLELIASQAAISLEQARLYAELACANEDLQTEIVERRRAEAALKKSEQQLQDIIDHTPALVTVKDLDLHYLLVNREHERVHAHRYQIRGKTDYDFLPGDVAETIRANDRLAIETGKPIQFELTIPMEHGERHYVVVKFPLRDGTGKPYAVCGISTDTTERKRAEEQQREAQAQLAHVTRVATLGELAGSIAHEVKQPLTAIINNADACLALLPAEIGKLEDVREALSDIISDADRASSVIDRIRGLIKKSPPQKSRLDLNETIGRAIALARGELDRNGVLLRAKLANDLPIIMGDRIQLQQVILNLIINGIEAMSGVSDGPRELSISSEKVIGMPGELEQGRLADVAGLEVERRRPNADLSDVVPRSGTKSDRRTQNAGVVVSVADSGPGLDLDNLGRLFDAFYTTKPQGLGMGLSISRSLIEAHGGRLWARANLPKGALFQFTLPIAND